MLLALYMVGAMSPPMVTASAVDSGKELLLLSGFAALADDVATRNVPLGVSLAERNLPETLTAYPMPEPDGETAPPIEEAKEDAPDGETEKTPQPEQSPTPAESALDESVTEGGEPGATEPSALLRITR